MEQKEIVREMKKILKLLEKREGLVIILEKLEKGKKLKIYGPPCKGETILCRIAGARRLTEGKNCRIFLFFRDNGGNLKKIEDPDIKEIKRIL